MLKYRLIIVGLCWLLGLSATALADQPIGVVSKTLGNVIVLRNHQQVVLTDRMALLEGDEITTPSNGKIRLQLKDGTHISLANRTTFKLTQYRYNPAQATSDVRFKLVEGAFRAVTGAIGQQQTPRFEVETRVATLGIRGTDFWGGFIFSDALDVTMFSGKGVYIQNEQGMVELRQAGQGTTVEAMAAPSKPKSWPDAKRNTAIEATAL